MTLPMFQSVMVKIMNRICSVWPNKQPQWRNFSLLLKGARRAGRYARNRK